MLQNAQMHQLVMQQMMLSALPQHHHHNQQQQQPPAAAVTRPTAAELRQLIAVRSHSHECIVFPQIYCFSACASDGFRVVVVSYNEYHVFSVSGHSDVLYSAGCGRQQ